MKVSVIMPAYNAAATISLALNSIQRQQSANMESDIEILVVDDGSTDNTANIVSQHIVSQRGGVKLVQQANRGPGAARNTGLALATGDVIGFLDADDLWLAHTVQTALTYFAQTPDAVIIQGQIRDLWRLGDSWRLDAPRFSFNLPGAFFRRAVLEQVGGFDETLCNREDDVDLWVRLTEQGFQRTTVASVFLLYRRRPNLDPQANQKHLSSLLNILHKSVERQRG